MRVVRRVLFAMLLAACAAGPTPTSHFDLAARTLADPRDVHAHLALAAYDDQHDRPSEAIAQLETVVHLGGPLGTRWSAEDRARLARLYVARAKARIARGAATARSDLDKARSLGAQIDPADDVAATKALAESELRHVDAGVRAQGRAHLAKVEKLPAPGPFGAWLWSIGARREAYEQLAVWRKSPAVDPALEKIYELAQAWWSSQPGPVEPVPAFAPDVQPVELADAPVVAAARYAHARFPGAPDEAALLEVARAYVKDPAVADRLARDVVAATIDASAGHAAIGALFDALGDPQRSRAAWQAAVDASPEPRFVRGLAEAAARTGDGSAALIFATQAAAAWGDPAVVWISVGDVLEQNGVHVEALTCARNALDLAGPDQLTHALDLAIAASRSLGRSSQADALVLQRVEAGSRPTPDATDPDAALLAHKLNPTAGTTATMWVASRAHPDALELRVALLSAIADDDTRHATIVAELVALAADPDPERGLAAAYAVSTRGR
jgi:tetratricopeptide (TPR) repeat protein